MQRIIRRFLEACSIACYAQNKTLEALFTRSFTYEKMLQSYSSIEELCRAVDFCLRQYRGIVVEREGEETPYTAQERIQDILHYLEENMDRMISRREAAKYVFLNEDYFLVCSGRNGNRVQRVCAETEDGLCGETVGEYGSVHYAGGLQSGV